jgi:hypothetical protein
VMFVMRLMVRGVRGSGCCRGGSWVSGKDAGLSNKAEDRS